MAVTLGIGAAVAAVGGVASGVMNANAAGKAANAASGYLNKGLGYETGIYDTAQTNLNPYITGGQEALGGLEQFLGLPGTGGATGAGMAPGSGALASYNQFMQTPYYTFPLSQSINTMDRAAAAKGISRSAGEVASLGQTAGNYAASNFKDYLGALGNLAGMGQSGANQLATVGTNISNQVQGTYANLGGVASQGIMGQQAGINQAINAVTGGAGQGGGTGSGGLINAGMNIAGGIYGSQTGSSYGPTGPTVPSYGAGGVGATSNADIRAGVGMW
jgi:hypothetical protein